MTEHISKKHSSGYSLTELVITGALLVFVSLFLAKQFSLSQVFDRGAAARLDAIRNNRLVSEVLRGLIVRRQPDGIQIFSDPYKIAISNFFGSIASPTTEVSEFRTVCESTAGTPLQNFSLSQPGVSFCGGAALSGCSAVSNRLSVQIIRGGTTIQTFPAPLAALTPQGTGYLNSAVATAICVVPSTPPATSPLVVSDGMDLRVEISTAYFRDAKNVVWNNESFTVSTSNRAVAPFAAVIPK